MKTSIGHIPQPMRNHVLEVVEIIKEIADPEMIILFGSYARGNFKRHIFESQGIIQSYISDMDFLVVTKDNPLPENEIAYLIEDKTDHYHQAVSIEVADIAYINEGLEFGQYFFSEIIKEGVLLHDKGNVTFSQKKELSPEEEKDKAQRYFDIWFPRSNGFLKGAKFQIGENEKNIAAFDLHQATESLYYAILLVYTGYKPKSHNLKHLRNQTKKYSQELFSVFSVESSKEEKRLFELLKRGYIDARYNPDYVITEEELSLLIERIEKMQVITEKVCKEKQVSSNEA